MVDKRVLSLVLALLFVMHGIRDRSFALAQDEATVRNGLGPSDQEYAVSARKELAVHGVTGISTRKVWLQGRKMAAHMLRKEYGKEPDRNMDKWTSKNSGKSSEASKKSVEGFDHSQDDEQLMFKQQSKNMINMLDQKTLEPASLGIPRSKPAVSLSSPKKQMQPQDSKRVKTIASLESSSMSNTRVEPAHHDSDSDDDLKAIETQRLLLATKEIETLMQKDYRGMSKPRRKPPINNHEPRH